MRRPVQPFLTLGVALALCAGVAAAPAASAAPAVNPVAVASVGLPTPQGHAGLYGWGATTMLDGSVLVGDYWNMRVAHFAADGAALPDFLPPSTAGFAANQHQAPYGLATDPVDGSIYLADTDRYKIDKYDASGNFLWTYGAQGKGPGKFLYPSRVAVGSDQKLYVADTWDNTISVHDPVDGHELSSFGSTGSALGQLKAPHGIAFDELNRLWVVDSSNHRVQVFSSAGQPLFALGKQGGLPGQFAGDMRGIAIDRSNHWVYVVDAQGNRVDKFSYDPAGTPAATYLLRWGTVGSGPGQFIDGGREATVAGDGNVWVGDMPNFREQVFSPTGAYLFEEPNPPAPPPAGGFNGPRGVAISPIDGSMYVTDTYNERIEKFVLVTGEGGTQSYQFSLQWGVRGRGDFAFNYPRMIAVDPTNGDVVIADTDNHRIKRYDANGNFLWQVGGLGKTTSPPTFKNPHGVDIAADGTIWVADSNNARVLSLHPDGTFAGVVFGTLGTGPGQFKFPRGIAVDPLDGTLWVADSVRDDVQHFTTTGQLLTTTQRIGGVGVLNNPFDVELDANYLYVADTADNLVKVYDRSGTPITSFGGGGTRLGKLQTPNGMDFAPNGHLYVAEQNNDRISEWSLY